MKPYTYHTHTTFCDGKCSVEEMIEGAIALGCDAIGFSSHSLTEFDESYCMPKSRTEEYRRAVRDGAEKYKDKIKVHLGIEVDIFSDVEYYSKGFDYIIGSAHNITDGQEFYSVDASEEQFLKNVNELFDGDFYAYCEEYFKVASTICERIDCDIIGHIDLVTKFNEGGRYFSESHPRYLAAAKKAVDKLCESGAIFEINTGAISRGYRKTPYPSREILKYIKEKGGRVTYSSDCHHKDGILCGYNEAVKYARECGFEGFMKLDGDRFVLVPFDEK